MIATVARRVCSRSAVLARSAAERQIATQPWSKFSPPTAQPVAESSAAAPLAAVAVVGIVGAASYEVSRKLAANDSRRMFAEFNVREASA